MSQQPKIIKLVPDYLLQAVAKFPDKPAVLHGKKSFSYSDIVSASRAQACWLASRGLEKSFRAAILTDDPFAYIVAYFAIQFAGGIVVGLNTQTSERSLKTVLLDSGASVVFSHKKFHRYLDRVVGDLSSLKVVVTTNVDECPSVDGVEWVALDAVQQSSSESVASGLIPENIAQIIYTSGTTGKPKGVMLRHSNLIANVSSTVQYLRLTEKDRGMAVLPFFYSYGNSIMLTHFAVGASLVVNQNFLYPNLVLDEMVHHEVTGFSGVPSTFALLLNRSAIKKYSFPSLRYITQAGAPMSQQLATRLKSVFPGVDIFAMYGQTEASPRLSYLAPADLDRKMGSIGKAIPGVTLKLLDVNGNSVANGQVGEIVATGENIMAGYWQRKSETDAVLRPEGLWTGDLATMDDEGYFYIVSRKSDMIKSGSHRIAPKEIEEVVHELGAVHEVAVVGKRDEILGEAIKACIVLKPGEICSEKEIIRHCRRSLPAFKVPHEVLFMCELPKTSSGKIMKKKLMVHGS
ncbi:MAG: AMP-binding protein [Desulfobulbaceae bacterium]|nr:AMP-binding protein [Desulfobulbaceae bacterium]